MPQGLPVYGRSMQLDPTFPYYRNRSVESVVSEYRSTGYGIVRYVLTAESSMNPALLAEFHRQKIGVWYMTFCNGSYTAKDLPPGWESWRMVTRTVLEGRKPDPSFLHLCLNNPGYRAWKKRILGDFLRTHPFQGVDLVEPHWPEYPGPSSASFGCFCDTCRAAFIRKHPEETGLPTLLDPAGPRGETGNPALWEKWIKFRTDSLVEFLHDLVNGPGGIRRSAPGVKVCVWTLALTEPDGVERMRRDSGEDAALVMRKVRPDLYGLQTHWPDWLRADLQPDYVRKFKPFVDQIRAVDPKMPLLIQADTGSGKANRRSWKWIRDFEAQCERMGVSSTTCYEYFIGDYIYKDPPRIFDTSPLPGGVALHFSKRLDEKAAGQASRYTVSAGKVTKAVVDGSIVRLTLTGVRHGRRQPVTLTARDIPDDETRRLFHDHPPTILREQTVKLHL
jgi:hypothetical protein